MSPIVETTLQAAALSAISNILAQTLKCYKNSTPFAYDFTTVFHFVLFTIISTPPNFLWQQQLESWFPAQVKEKKEKGIESRFSKTNTLKKFMTDQLVGSPINTVLFIGALGFFRGLIGKALLEFIKAEFWPLSIAGLKLWPAVSLISFSLVPAERRIVFGSLVALGWNVYLGMVMS